MVDGCIFYIRTRIRNVLLFKKRPIIMLHLVIVITMFQSLGIIYYDFP